MSKHLTGLFSWELFWLLLLIPASIFIGKGSALLLLLLPLLWGGRLLFKKEMIPTTILNESLLFLFIAVFISIYPAINELAWSMGKLGGMVFGLAILFEVVRWGRKGEQSLYWLGGGYLLMGTGIAFLALIGTEWSFKVPIITSILLRLNQLGGLLPGGLAEAFHPNQIAGVLLWVAPFSMGISLIVWLGKWERPLLTGWQTVLLHGISCFLFIVLILVQSRIALLGYGGAFLLILFSLYQRVWSEKRYWGVWGVVGMIAIFALLLVWQKSDVVDAGSFSGSLATRQEVWQRAVYVIEDFGWTGLGLDRFRTVIPVLYPFLIIDNKSDIAHAHNQFLHVGAELGIIGLWGYLSLWGILLWEGVSRLRKRPLYFNLRELLFWGCFSSLVAYFIYGMADLVALGAKPAFLWWWLVGLYLVLSSDSQEVDISPK